MEVLLLREADIRELVGPSEALRESRAAFAKLGRGEVVLPEVMFLDLPEHRGEVHAKGAYLRGTPYFSIKVASGFSGNPERGLLVFCRTEGSAAAFAAEMEFSLGVSVRAAGSAREAVEEADIVVTTTTSRGPVVFDGWIRPGTHIAAIGSDVPEKQELDPALLGRAKVVADRLAQCVTQGEIHHAIEARSITVDQVYAELGEIAAGLKPGRETDKEITICDMTGVGALDAAMANVVVTAAMQHHVGERIRA